MSARDLDVSENSVRQGGPVYPSKFSLSLLLSSKYSLSHYTDFCVYYNTTILPTITASTQSFHFVPCPGSSVFKCTFTLSLLTASNAMT
jgi:hypothetical protein